MRKKVEGKFESINVANLAMHLSSILIQKNVNNQRI